MKSTYNKKPLVWAIIIFFSLAFIVLTVLLVTKKNPFKNLSIGIVVDFVSLAIPLVSIIINHFKTKSARKKTKAQLISFLYAGEFIERLTNTINVCIESLHYPPKSREFESGRSELKVTHIMLNIVNRRTKDLLKLITQNQDALDIARESVSSSLLACHKTFNQFISDFYDYNYQLIKPEILEKTISELEAAKECLTFLRSDIDAIRQSKLFQNVDFGKEDVLDYLPEKLIKRYNVRLEHEIDPNISYFSSRMCFNINTNKIAELEHDVTEIMSYIIPDNNVSFRFDKEIDKSKNYDIDYIFNKEDYFAARETIGGKTGLYIYFPMIYG